MHSGLIGPVLIALPTGRDATLAAAVIAEAGLPTIICRTLPELTGSISSEASAILLAQEALKDKGFDEFLDALTNQSPWSDIPLLYLNGLRAPASSLKFGERLLNKTSVTLLDRPLRRATLISAVQGALRARQR